jgi:hypothetical protein
MLLWRKMMDKMNTENFKILVDALEALPDEIKNNKVEMRSLEDPTTLSPSLIINISISTSIITPNRGIFPRPHLD